MKVFRVSGSLAMRAVVSCILALCMMVPVIGAAAQSGDATGLVSDTEYDLLSGNVLTWDDPWTVLDDQTGFNAGWQGDYVVLLDDEASRLDFLSTPAIGSLQSNLDSFTGIIGYSYDAGELLQLDAVDKRSGHAVLRFSSGGSDYAAYIDIQSTEDLSTYLVTMLIGPLDDIGNVIASVQDAVVLDDAPLLDGVDTGDVQDLAETGEAIDFPLDRNQFDFGDEEDDSNEDIKLPDDDTEPTATPADNDVADPSDLGLVDDTTYESPQFGTEVLWGSDWEADTTLLISDEDTGVDRIAVENGDYDATLYLSFYDSGEVSPEDWAQSFIDQFDTAGSDLTILDQGSEDGIETFYYRLDGDEGSQFGVIEARLLADEDVTVVVELLGSQDDVRDAFSSAQDDITIDDDDLFQDFSRFPRITKSDLG